MTILVRLIAATCFLPVSLLAQHVIVVGKVTNSNRAPVKYASIGIINKVVGTVSDSSGTFSIGLDLSELKKNDSLMFSALGYRSRAISVSQFLNAQKDSLFMILEEKSFILREVTINSKRVDTIGSRGKSLLNMSVNLSITKKANQNLGAEIGRLFSIKHKNTCLKSFRFYLADNNYEELMFMVRVYGVKNLMPDSALVEENILQQVKGKKKGWIEVDLSSYNIYTNNNVVMAIEWISKSGRGSRLRLPIAMPVPHVHYYRFGAQNKWNRFTGMSTHMELVVNY